MSIYVIQVDLIVLFIIQSEAVGSFAENQKITAVRKVYQKGIMTPMTNVELLWKDYCTYEMVCEHKLIRNRLLTK